MLDDFSQLVDVAYPVPYEKFKKQKIVRINY